MWAAIVFVIWKCESFQKTLGCNKKLHQKVAFAAQGCTFKMSYHAFGKSWFIYRCYESSVCFVVGWCTVYCGRPVTSAFWDYSYTLYCSEMFFVFSDEKKNSLNDTVKFGAFADTNKKNIDSEIIIPEVPFTKLIISQRQERASSPPPLKEEDDCSKTIVLEDHNGNSPTEQPKTALTLKPTNDDFIMVELVNFFSLTCAIKEGWWWGFIAKESRRFLCLFCWFGIRVMRAIYLIWSETSGTSSYRYYCVISQKKKLIALIAPSLFHFSISRALFSSYVRLRFCDPI